jgi:NADH:ubiquinone oxidoreductase subunit 3 (subunit A)
MTSANLDTFLVFVAVAVAFGGGSLVLNRIFGARVRKSYLQATTYECGEEPEGEAQIDFPSQHYVFAIVFVSVDVLGLILALWAVSFRDLLSSWVTPTLVVVGFTLLALVGIYYALRRESFLWV